ncbi:DUF397 domain-containing protein [Streptomyces sp. NPDC006739]|uniref:DUF397 domain-containing protein n=1 Tax=Streptomyces sp. NPDC006739 TaxID=3364763 RepID=UPI003695ECAE
MSTGELSWFKSSYSSGGGGECLEAAYSWHKSSYSDGEGGQCFEISPTPTHIHIRDSKSPTTSHLSLTPTAWCTFLSLAKGTSRDRIGNAHS